jgi:hypothetical protein
MCKEAMLGISLYSYHYFKLAKMLCLSYYLFNKIEEGGWEEGEGAGAGWEMAQTIYAHLNK